MRVANSLVISTMMIGLVLTIGIHVSGAEVQSGAKTSTKHELRYQMPQGTKFDFSVDRTRQLKQAIPGRDASADVIEHLLFGVTVQSIKPEGMDLSLSYKERSRQVKRPDFSGSVDFSGLIGKQVQMMLSPDGKLSEFQGFSDLPEVVIKGEQRIMRRQEYVSDLVTCFPQLPYQPVGVGDSWSYETSYFERFMIGQVKITVNTTYTVLADTVRNGIKCLKCSGKSTLNARGQGIEEESGLRLDVDISGESADTIYFAYEKEMLLESGALTTISGTSSNVLIRYAAPFNYRIHTTAKSIFK